MKFILNGYSGRMGQVICELADASAEISIAAGVALPEHLRPAAFPAYDRLDKVTEAADAVIDFTHVNATEELLAYCVRRRLPLVLATTGHTVDQLAKIDAAAKYIPIFKSANMSLGINLLLDLARKAARVLGGGFDVEIVERHHNKKLDAPSGTAVMIADAIAAELPEPPEYIYSRHDGLRARGRDEIGISSVRGGTIVGEHEIIFAGYQELLTITHSAQSREVFASGALTAAGFIARRSPGLYDMGDLVASL